MVDRILHIGHRFSKKYDKELLQRAAEAYISKGPAAVATHLTVIEKLAAEEAQVLAQKINREMVHVNREVLLYYAVMFGIFLFVVVVSLVSQSYIFAGIFALPALRILYSIVKFVRRNKLQ